VTWRWEVPGALDPDQKLSAPRGWGTLGGIPNGPTGVELIVGSVTTHPTCTRRSPLTWEGSG
jgi:hypothetical protein